MAEKGTYTVGKTNEETLENFCREELGLNSAAIAGIKANVKSESNFKTGAIGDSGTSYGICQWHAGRFSGLKNWCAANGKDYTTLDGQLWYMKHELETGYAAVYSFLKSVPNTAQGAYDAGYRWCLKFEVPANTEATSQKRGALARDTYWPKMSGASAQEAPKTAKTSAEIVLAVAVGQIGYMEKATKAQLDDPTANAGSANWTKYARDFDEKYPNWYNGKKNGYAWCDMFVDWCFLTAFGYETALRLLCQPERSAGAGCTYSLMYYRNKGQFHTSGPKPGDQIFFGTSLSASGHTGIVERVDSSKVYTIEGNTSDRVARRSYYLTDKTILGYGRPAYDTAPVTQTPAPAQTTTPAAPSVKVEAAHSFDRSVAGAYTVTTGLNLRAGSGTNKAVLVVMPKGAVVRNYGYYNTVDGTKWLYVQYATGGKTYTGFCSSKYLKK